MPSSYVNLLYHVVFTTKHRMPRLTAELQTVLYPYMGGIVSGFRGVLLEAGGMEDHVHLLLSLRPAPSVAEVVKNVKGGSSRWLNQRPGAGEPFAWQEGYGAFTVSPSQLETVRRYIQRQEEHHRTMSFEDEWASLLRKHGLEAEKAAGQGRKPGGEPGAETPSARD
jgi:REP element-mobilizing transposase RayT